MTKIRLNDDISAKGPVTCSSFSPINCLRCFVLIVFCVMLTSVVANQSGDKTSLLAQGSISGDKPLDNNNINLSSSMSQTNEPGDLGEDNISRSTENQTSSPKLPILTEVSDKGIYKVELRWSSPYVYVGIRQGRFDQTVRASGSQSSGSSSGLSTELATSTKARDSTDSAIAIIVSRT